MTRVNQDEIDGVRSHQDDSGTTLATTEDMEDEEKSFSLLQDFSSVSTASSVVDSLPSSIAIFPPRAATSLTQYRIANELHIVITETRLIGELKSRVIDAVGDRQRRNAVALRPHRLARQ